MSDEVEIDVYRAEAFEQQGDWDQAVEIWSRLSQGREADRFLVRCGRALARAGRVEEAEATLRRAIEAAPDDASGYFQLGMLFEDHDRLAEAKEVLERGLLRRESQPVLTILGGVLVDLGDTEVAEKILTRSLSLNAEDDEAHFLLGYAIKDSDPERALVHIREAIRIDPDLPKAHRELGWLLWHFDDLSEAEREMRQAVAREPDDAWAHDYLGHLVSFKKDFEGSRIEFAKAAELDSTKDVFWCDMAQALNWLGRNDEADAAFSARLVFGCESAVHPVEVRLVLEGARKTRQSGPIPTSRTGSESFRTTSNHSSRRDRDKTEIIDGFTWRVVCPLSCGVHGPDHVEDHLDCRARPPKRDADSGATEIVPSETDCTRDFAFLSSMNRNRAYAVKPRNPANEVRFPASL